MKQLDYSYNSLLNDVALKIVSSLKMSTLLVIEALQSSKISNRQVCVKWWKLGRYFYGFRMDDKSHSHYVSLEDLAIMKEYEVMDVIDQGTCRVG